MKVDTAQRYRRFARFEAYGHSPCYADRSRRIADDPEVLALVEELPAAKRQPNLVLASARYVGARQGRSMGSSAWIADEGCGVVPVGRVSCRNRARRREIGLFSPKTVCRWPIRGRTGTVSSGFGGAENSVERLRLPPCGITAHRHL
ncbi:DUF2332 family protein [Nocardia sp. NPDC050793]|uniref:DUF2332 family protein n=1 Tax=Nocardia sp. NPDC050793 TaxID=3155159 RepID=UPI0033F07DA5